MDTRALLISIKPDYAGMIFEGIKKVELRRTRPKVGLGDVAIIYASSPRKAILGLFEVETVVGLPVSQLWKQVYKKAGIDFDEFTAYYEGAETGYAIFFREICLFPESIELEQLRDLWGKFHPPQSYRYLDLSQLRELETLAQYPIVDRLKSYQGELLLTA